MHESAHELALRAGLRASRVFLGVPVTYTSGATTFTIPNAVPGEQRHGSLNDTGTGAIILFCDWRIGVDEFRIAEPLVGDTITRVYSGGAEVWEVTQQSFGANHWEWSDTGRSQYLIRSRRVGDRHYDDAKPDDYDISGNLMEYE